MEGSGDQLTQILERLDNSERNFARRQVWVAIFSTIVAAVTAIVASWLVADATIESNNANILSGRDAFVAAQRRDSYATLGRTVRDQLRILQVTRDKLARDELPGQPISSIVGTAYRTTRSDAVDTELVGDDKAGQMARCMVRAFYVLGSVLGRLTAAVQANSASAKDLEAAKESLNDLQRYDSDFIAYGAENLFPVDTAKKRVGGVDPNCPW